MGHTGNEGITGIPFSREGVTQGDPISMFMYAIGTLPLIQLLKNTDKWSQVSYADDSSVSGELSSLQEWLTMLMERGPDFGYFPEPSKSYLIVNESNRDLANLLFGDFGLKIATSGRLLGGIVGDKEGRESFVEQKVKNWMTSMQQLVSEATTKPQAAYCAFTKSLQSEWKFLKSIVPECGWMYIDLEEIISNDFLQALFGSEITPEERLLFSLPARMGVLTSKTLL